MSRENRAAPHAPDYSIAIPVVQGALALATEFFPRRTADGKTYVRTADALFFLSGQMEKWSRWPHLPLADKALIARLLRWRPVEMANRNVFADLLDILLPGHIHDFRALGDGTVLVEVTHPARQIAADCAQQLWLERQVRRRHPMTIANKGNFATWIRGHLPGSGYVQATYSLDISPKTGPETPIDLGAPAQAGQIDVPVAELEAIATYLDSAFGEQHRTSSMRRIFTKIQAGPANHARRVWTLRAGTTRTFNAPTGIGKNVAAELLASWCTQHGKVTTLLVPSNAAVIRAAASIEASQRALGIDADVVPLMSPDAAHKEAEAAATRGPGASALGLWAYQGIWPGLNNSTFGHGLLPGASLGHPDLAVVRCANGERVPQPTHRGHGQSARYDPYQPPLPRGTLYEHDEDGTYSWLLAQASRTYRSSQLGARAGASFTRWTLPESRASLMGKDWHGLTAIEIAIADPGQWQPRHLAALTARLWQQAASWDDRTQNPAPLHLAERPDLDHPDHGEQPEDADDPV